MVWLDGVFSPLSILDTAEREIESFSANFVCVSPELVRTSLILSDKVMLMFLPSKIKITLNVHLVNKNILTMYI